MMNKDIIESFSFVTPYVEANTKSNITKVQVADYSRTNNAEVEIHGL